MRNFSGNTKTEFEKSLFETYPDMLPVTEDHDFLKYGIECGPGWYNLIWDLTTTIHKYCLDNNKEPVKMLQIKEKFGGLRYYINSGDKIIVGMIWMTEAMSHNTCEDCGEPGKKVGLVRIKTLCNGCAK